MKGVQNLLTLGFGKSSSPSLSKKVPNGKLGPSFLSELLILHFVRVKKRYQMWKIISSNLSSLEKSWQFCS